MRTEKDPSNRAPFSGASCGRAGNPRTDRRLLQPLAFLLAFLSALSALPTLSPLPAEAVQNFTLSIGVAEGVSSGKLLGNGLSLRDAKGAKIGAANGATVTIAGNSVKVGKKTLALPVRVSAKSDLGWDKNKYRGTLKLIKAGGGFTVVNDVELESYLRGILKIEMNPDWHHEALKAQAILARTYAAKNRGRFKARGFDLCATANSQVYRGINAEDARTDRAITATKGQILSYAGAPADIYYHSDSGGSTADVAHVWGGSRPYLQARKEPVGYQSPYSTWQVVMTPAQIASILGKMGKNVGTVSSLSVAQADNAGRAVQLLVVGSAGRATVKAHDFRMAAGSSVIRSTHFTVDGTPGASQVPLANPPQAAAPKAEAQPTPTVAPGKIESLADFPPNADPLTEMTKLNVFTKDEVYDMLFNPKKRDDYIRLGLQRLAGKTVSLPQTQSQPQKTAAPTPTSAPTPTTGGTGGKIVFNGKGWGHGVGLSQWGAKAMADQGMKCAQILSHYFPGTAIAK